MVLRARLSNLFNKMARQMTILTDFDNLHFFEIKEHFAKKSNQ